MQSKDQISLQDHPIKKYNFRKEDYANYMPKKYYSIPEDETKLAEKLKEIEN